MSMTALSRCIENALAPRAVDVNSPAFRAWFSGSKVVDLQGRPLVVYHGTGNSFSRFARHSYTEREGFYFTACPAYASDFAEMSADGIAYDDDEEAQGASVLPVFLSIRNPIDVRNGWPESVADELGDVVDREWLTGLSPSDYWLAMDGDEGASIWSRLESLGYDGLIATESEMDTYVAFRPGQIKSAICNAGAFDPANPDFTDGARLDLVRPTNSVEMSKGISP